jgi:hypothetical protein
MTKKIISLCPHLQRFKKEAPINLEDVLYAIDKGIGWVRGGAVLDLFCSWEFFTDYRKQPKEVKDLIKSILR